MAKTQKFGGKMKTRVVSAVKGKKPELQLQNQPSNSQADKRAQMIFYGLSALSVLLIGSALFWAISTLVAGIRPGFAHANWPAVIGGAITIGITIFLARALAWLSYFGAIIYASKTGAWQSLEQLCQSALKRWRIFPGGAATAALMLVQSLVSRGQFDEAIAIGEQQYNLHGNDDKFNESLSPMYTSLGMAFQVKGDSKQSVIWTDRGIASMQRALESIAQRKGWRANMAGPQADEWAKTLKMQLAVAHFNNAMSYMNQMNYRQAKQLFKQAVDYCNQSPEFPEKSEIVRISREQLARLKHS